MGNFYVNKNTDEHNNHEVHRDDCIFLPSPHNRELLGWFTTSKDAVAAAKKKYSKVDGCWFCCPESHQR